MLYIEIKYYEKVSHKTIFFLNSNPGLKQTEDNHLTIFENIFQKRPKKRLLYFDSLIPAAL